MDNKEYVVTFRMSGQISPDDWDVWSPTMKVTPETTVAEIIAFYRSKAPAGHLEVKLIELSKPQ